MVFTSVAGHLMELDFDQIHKKWHGCAPIDLYTATVHKNVPQVSLQETQQIFLCLVMHQTVT
jgi:hypothetical protein